MSERKKPGTQPSSKPELHQLELDFSAPARVEISATASSQTAAPAPVAADPRSRFRVIQGGGKRVQEPLESRDAVVRVLLEAGADLLLRRISPERAEVIEQKVDKILGLFDAVDSRPILMPVLRRELDDLEALMTETRQARRRQG